MTFGDVPRPAGGTPAIAFTDRRRPEDATRVRLPEWEGPLGLLLALVEARRLDVMTVPLGALAEAYLDAIAGLEGDRLGNLSTFVAVASQLILIKSRELLPRPPEPAVPLDDEPDAEAALRARLIAYRAFRDAADRLAAPAARPAGRQSAASRRSRSRRPAPGRSSRSRRASTRRSSSAPSTRLAAVTPAVTPPPEAIPRTISMAERADLIRAALGGRGPRRPPGPAGGRPRSGRRGRDLPGHARAREAHARSWSSRTCRGVPSSSRAVPGAVRPGAGRRPGRPGRGGRVTDDGAPRRRHRRGRGAARGCGGHRPPRRRAHRVAAGGSPLRRRAAPRPARARHPDGRVGGDDRRPAGRPGGDAGRSRHPAPRRRRSRGPGDRAGGRPPDRPVRGAGADAPLRRNARDARHRGLPPAGHQGRHRAGPRRGRRIRRPQPPPPAARRGARPRRRAGPAHPVRHVGGVPRAVRAHQPRRPPAARRRGGRAPRDARATRCRAGRRTAITDRDPGAAGMP